MCFMLHISAGCSLPQLAWDEDDRHVWIGDVGADAEAVREHFSMPDVAYIGSDVNCGCGFRNVSFQNGDWPEEYLIQEDEIDTEGTGKNHQELHAVLAEVLRRCVAVELYGCWAGDYGHKTEREQDIEAEAILSERFFFRERVLYRFKRKANNGTPAHPQTSGR